MAGFVIGFWGSLKVGLDEKFWLKEDLGSLAQLDLYLYTVMELGKNTILINFRFLPYSWDDAQVCWH